MEITVKKSILFVDDDEDVLFCYRMLTESENITIYTAQDVASALKIVRESGIDVAILDYMLPELHGDELAKRINQIDPLVKIVFITGYDIAVDALKELNDADYGVYMKPLEPEVLARIIDSEDYASNVY